MRHPAAALFARPKLGSTLPPLIVATVRAARRVLGGISVAIAMSIPALAADMPVKALAPAPAFYDWSGVYFGVHAGYGGGMKDWGAGAGITADFLARGGFGGGQIGINKQLGSLVFGLELDGSWANLGGSQSIVIGGPAINAQVNSTTASKIAGLVTFAGRAGLAADRWFVFAKGGLTIAHENHSVNFLVQQFPAGPNQNLVAAGRENRVAPMLGFGAEYALGNNWSVKSEYDYIHLGSRNVGLSGTVAVNGVVTPVPVLSAPVEQAMHLVKLGVNYRFGGVATDPTFAPVPAAAGNNWSGGYVGVVGGYGRSHKERPGLFDATNPGAGRFDINGWLGGGTVGANAQAGVLVFGVEGDWTRSGIRGSQNIVSTGFSTGTTIPESKVNWLATAAARAGFVVGDKLLLFGKGGVAIADERHSLIVTVISNPAGAANLAGTAVHTGVVVGAGAELALGGNWSIKGEYDYIKMLGQPLLGTGSVTGAGLVPGNGTIPFANPFGKLSQDMQLVKFGVNYHFSPTPMVVTARY